MIVDWDVHHGNGTEKTFYETDKVRSLAARALGSPCSLAHNVGLGGDGDGDGGDQVLFLSLHRFEPDFYPNSGPLESVGAGEGKGYNINVPWNFFGAGNAEYLYAFEQLVVPVAKAYQPDLVLVSCGFDAAWGDPLGGMTITASGYQQMTRMLLEATNGKVVLALEGIRARSLVCC
jgi:histone deacetylase 6